MEQLKRIAETIKPRYPLLEIGSWHGKSTQILAQRAKELQTFLICVDWWRGTINARQASIRYDKDSMIKNLSKFHENIKEYQDIIVPIIARVDIALTSILNNLRFSLIFIDGDHRYNNVKFQIEWSRSRTNLVCGHDYDGEYDKEDIDKIHQDEERGTHYGVIHAVNNVFGRYNFDQANGFWWSIC